MHARLSRNIPSIYSLTNSVEGFPMDDYRVITKIQKILALLGILLATSKSIFNIVVSRNISTAGHSTHRRLGSAT